MPKPSKDKSEVFAKRTISVPPDLDGIIEEDAWDNHDTYSGRIVKGMRLFYGKDLIQNDLLKNQDAGKRDAC
jgi:hypothetical protein